MAIATMAKEPGLDGRLHGIFGGFITGMISVFVTLVAPMRSLIARRMHAAAVAALPPVDDPSFDPILVELETVRHQTQQHINQRIAFLLPIGFLLGLGFGLLKYFHPSSGHSGSIFDDVLLFAVVGGAIGYAVAARGPATAYAQLYKAHVLPKLAASFGALQYRHAQPPLEDIARDGLFPEWGDAKSHGSASAEDELYGEYHGLPLSIMDLRLTIPGSKQPRLIFGGMLVTLTLPRHLYGITVILPGHEVGGGLLGHLGTSLQPVHLEDPDFTRLYHVRATDQVAARALLTPAFMQRFLALQRACRLNSLPAALAQDNRMMLALETPGGTSLFEAPSYRTPTDARETLAVMRGAITSILHSVDAVMALDQSTRQPPQTQSVPN
ncbi:MAG: DUF3137 domain-containing protein [Acidobacteriaceae bacterium]|nr:DUF3137 domain-containing protein [Acidobacteriaceae bacterium]